MVFMTPPSLDPSVSVWLAVICLLPLIKKAFRRCVRMRIFAYFVAAWQTSVWVFLTFVTARLALLTLRQGRRTCEAWKEVWRPR